MPESGRPGSVLGDALRIAAFARVPVERLRVSWMAIAVAALVAACVPTLHALATLEGEGTWGLHGAPGVLFFVPVFLLGAAVAARLVHREDAIAPTLFAALLAWIVIDTVSLAAWAALPDDLVARDRLALGDLFYYGPLAWLAFAVARFATTLAPVGGGRQLVVLAACALLLAVPLGVVQPERSLWVKDWSRSADEDASRWAAAEEVAFYRQPALLARELAAVQRGRPGVVDVFFIGMAGYGHQDVFMREVESVAALMRERFGAGERTVKLVNNIRTVHTAPIASLTSLEAALGRVAQQMDAEEDVLVLFLTSHGSAEHRFQLDLFPLRLRELDPGALRRALDASGIRNRVVIVSACYAGGFVEALRDPHTLVIAAAAPDRNSFGCSNEAEWTYFGKAYFDEGLRTTFSFTRAFEIAAPSIAERERREGHTPSKPMMLVGEAIGGTLARLERQLAGGSHAASAGGAATSHPPM